MNPAARLPAAWDYTVQSNMELLHKACLICMSVESDLPLMPVSFLL